jgi:hypothetical protein
MDCGEKVSGGLIVAGGNGSVLFELAIEVFHEVARFVHFLVVGALELSIALGRDHGRFSCRKQRLDDTQIGIEGLVRQQGIGLHLRQQRVSAFQIVGLTCGQQERQRIAKRIDHGMDFGAQPAFAAPDRLVFAVFFWAPALCWCARTMVLSIMAYSLSASAASISNIFFHTPLFAQRENRV